MKLKVLFILACIVFTPVTLIGQRKAKKIVVTGVVSDINGQALEMVSIFVDEKNTSVFTDANGYYRIKVKPTVETISAFSVFKGTHEVAYKGQTIINFILKGDIPGSDQNQDEERQIDAGYQTIDEDDGSTNIKSVNIEEKSTGSYIDIYDMIKQEFPGVIVNGKSIKLRGVTSFQLTSEPLFVIDGNPVNSVDGVNPREVESISILNGASASIYGSRGSNGVILIRMK